MIRKVLSFMDLIWLLIKQLMDYIDRLALLLYSPSTNNGVVHLSFDDVWRSLEEISVDNSYNSIFDHKFFCELKKLHENYGVVVSLFVLENESSYRISNVTSKFKEEFISNSNWLKFGYHGISTDIIKNDYKQFKNSYLETIDSIKRFAGVGSLCNTIRLHGFYANSEIVKFLKSQDIRVLLCSDDRRINYDLNYEENISLFKKGYISHNEISYLRTDLRLERLLINRLYKKKVGRKDHMITVFGHEKNFFFFEKKLKSLCKWFNANKYEFVFSILESGEINGKN